ncbi:MAG: ATP-grasp domain-containing protein [Desulfuromusa sp.]|nr:ATP-grasp domain-containing protein [Desulfuromusa sp.]
MSKRTVGTWIYQNGGGDIVEEKLVAGLREREIETITDLNLRYADVNNDGIFCNGTQMDNLDLFFSYNAGEQSLYQIYLYELLDLHIPIINSFKGFSISEDKMKTDVALKIADIPRTNFYLCHRDETEKLREAVDKWGSKAVYKPVDGWGGMGMTLIESEHDLDQILPFLNQLDIRFFYIEKFINYDGTDYRVDVVDGEAISCYGRRAKKGDWRTNVTSGGSVFLRELTDELADLAVKAAAAVRLDIAGVDIIYDREREEYIVLEVNGIPAFATPDQESIGLGFNDRKIEKIIALIDRKTSHENK